ncbi:hypothetical protein AC579_8056 [Pseudocercospora musae]|uniref:Uncharacterized protein n=1 Tax=Pseudocercospora musae TaxID=113226 RepID=A0A139IPY1_9PEZI|nr:hypothetical protein AC579_8056 [Pseudocercospora musae]
MLVDEPNKIASRLPDSSFSAREPSEADSAHASHSTSALNMSDPSENNIFFIFDSTRLRSHLFFRWLSTHPNVYPIYHPYVMAAMFGPDGLGWRW